MANYYLDFVGLNTFIYEPCGYDISWTQGFSPIVLVAPSDAGSPYPYVASIDLSSVFNPTLSEMYTSFQMEDINRETSMSSQESQRFILQKHLGDWY